ncbi:MAG: serine/threonine protein kinase [Deltaproteobacteria bacterium]|nr:serine/threonine protein kinase [Deltaproteobacteria bacterium]
MATNNDSLFKPGTVIDNKWIIIEMIGQGAMGKVFRAHQINLKRDVAVKTISEDMLQELENDPEELKIAFKRFQREVQTMAQVRHPNILNIFDYGGNKGGGNARSDQPGSVEYIVMEYIPGNSLRFTMSDDGLNDDPELYAAWIESYFLAILEGVEAMHNHNIFHRDLKPENIFMDGEIPKIADFGLARSCRMKAVSNSMEMKGTLTYMAPEQFSDFRKADQTADIYALGKMLFEAIDGRLNQKTLPMKTVSLKNYKNIDVPFLKGMDAIIQKATAEDKASRFQSVAELRAELLKTLALNKVTPEDPDTLPLKAAEFVQAHSKWIWIGIILTLLSIAGMTAWHIIGSQKNAGPLEFTEKKPVANDKAITLPANPQDLKKSIIAMDGSRMILTGSVDNQAETGESPAAPHLLFYIDENKISNYLFVDFLNDIKDRIIVKNGIVKHNGIILLYLGPGTQKEDQIIYKHQRFHLKDPEAAGNPVTRVTYHGALAYAKYYGRSLLTDPEWRFSYRFHLDKYIKEHPLDKQKNQDPSFSMMHGAKEKQTRPEEVQVLDQMGLKIKEWVRIESKPEQEPAADIRLFSGVMDLKILKAGSEPAMRQQWEGFPDVGFRTKISIK